MLSAEAKELSERDQGDRAGMTTGEKERLKQLERENRELKRANEILCFG
jgi:transposase